MMVMETSLKDLCSSCDIHAAHALTDSSTQEKATPAVCAIFCHIQRGGNISDFLFIALAM